MRIRIRLLPKRDSDLIFLLKKGFPLAAMLKESITCTVNDDFKPIDLNPYINSVKEYDYNDDFSVFFSNPKEVELLTRVEAGCRTAFVCAALRSRFGTDGPRLYMHAPDQPLFTSFQILSRPITLEIKSKENIIEDKVVKEVPESFMKLFSR